MPTLLLSFPVFQLRDRWEKEEFPGILGSVGADSLGREKKPENEGKVGILPMECLGFIPRIPSPGEGGRNPGMLRVGSGTLQTPGVEGFSSFLGNSRESGRPRALGIGKSPGNSQEIPGSTPPSPREFPDFSFPWKTLTKLISVSCSSSSSRGRESPGDPLGKQREKREFWGEIQEIPALHPELLLLPRNHEEILGKPPGKHWKIQLFPWKTW